jgi:hypothetical protein
MATKLRCFYAVVKIGRLERLALVCGVDRDELNAAIWNPATKRWSAFMPHAGKIEREATIADRHRWRLALQRHRVKIEDPGAAPEVRRFDSSLEHNPHAPIPHGGRVQSLLFDRARWGPKSASNWALDHKFVSPTPDITEQKIRLRQYTPDASAERYRTIEFRPGVQAVIGFAKGRRR